MPTKLERLRAKQGISRSQLARETGIPYSTLCEIEAGVKSGRVILTHMRTLAEYYRQPLDVRELLS